MSYKKTIFYLLLFLGLSFAASVVQAQEMPFIEASVNGDWMAVYGFEPDEAITITIYDYEGAPDPLSTSVPLDGDGNAQLAPEVLGKNLIAGNHIIATDGTTTKDLVLVSLSVSGVDYESDTVWGTAETDLPLRVQVGDDQQSFSLDVSLDTGEWIADFGAEGIQILDHYWIGIIATEEDGDWTLAEFRPPPYINGNVTGNWVSINAFPPNTLVAITVFNELGDSEAKCSGDLVTDPWGSAQLDCWEEGLDAGNYITADDGETTKDLLLVPLTLDVFDPEADIISGTADSGTRVRVDVWVDDTNNAIMEVITDDDGNWEADFDGYDILEDAWYAAFVTDDDGDSTMAELPPPPAMPFFTANVTGSWISADSFPPDTDVTVDVYEGELPSELRFSATLRTDESGSAWFDFWEQGLYPDNYVVVTDGVNFKDLVIQPLTLDVFDPEADIISGTALPDTPVRVDVWVDESNNASLEVIAGDDGNWLADFNTIEPEGYDLLEEAGYAAFIDDEDGDATMAELAPPPPLPWIEANITGDWIDVFGFLPITPVTISVYEVSGDVNPKCEETVISDEEGYASIECWEVGLEPGNFVMASDDETTKDLLLVPLTVDVFDPEGSLIEGTAEEGTLVVVNVYNPPPEDSFASLEVQADADGNWSAEFTDFTITQDAWYGAYVFDDEGDATMAELPPPPPLPFFAANVTGGWISADGFPPDTDVTVDVYEGELPSELRFSAMLTTNEDGSTWFDFWEQGLYPYNYVEVTDGVVTKHLVIQPLTLDVFDPDANIISGTALPGTPVRVDVWVDETNNASLEVISDEEGNWLADFNTIEPDGYDLLEEAWYAAFIDDEDGDATMAELTPPPPLPFILAWPDWDLVYGIGFPEEVTVNLLVGDVEDPTGPPLYSASGMTGPAPWNPSETLVEFALDGFVDLRHGHIVVLIYEDIVKVHFVTRLEVTVVRPYPDKIIGIAEPLSGIDLWIQEDPEIGISVEAGEYGFWVADFTGAYDIRPDTYGIAAQFDEDGDATFIEWSWLHQGGWCRRCGKWQPSERWGDDFKTTDRHKWRTPSHPCSKESAFSRYKNSGPSFTECRDRGDTNSGRRQRTYSSDSRSPSWHDVKGDK